MAAVNLNNERIIWATWMLSKSIPISGSVKIAPSHPTDSSLYDLTPPPIIPRRIIPPIIPASITGASGMSFPVIPHPIMP